MPSSIQISGSPTQKIVAAQKFFDNGKFAEASALAGSIDGQASVAAYALHLRGLAAARLGALEEAQEWLRKAVAANPNVARFHYDQGNVLQDLGKLDRAISAYRRALRLRPLYEEALNDLGTAYFQKGWLDEAIDSYRKSLAINPRHGVAHSNLAAAYRRQQDYVRARQHLYAELKCRFAFPVDRLLGSLRKLLTAGGNASPGPKELGMYSQACLDRGEFELAEMVSREALNGDATQQDALLALLRALEWRKAFDEALIVAESAPDGLRRNADFQFRYGNILVGAGRMEEARAAYRAALRLRPRFPKAMNNLGSALLDQNHVDAAIALYRDAVGVNGGYAEGWANLALALSRKGDLDEAEQACRRALELAPDNVHALDCMAKVHWHKGNLTQAEQCHVRIAELQPEAIDNLLQLGLLQREQGRADDAANSWREALRIDPACWRAYNYLGQLYTDIAKSDKALESFNAGLKRNPGNVDILVSMGRLHELDGNLVSAEESLSTALELDPSNPDVLNGIGMLHYQQGRTGEAIDYYRQAVSASPGFVRAQVNLGHALLQEGNLESGWQLYEHRQESAEYHRVHSRIPLPKWQGSAFAGQSLLVYHEQGIGDEMMFASCLPDLLRHQPRCTVFCTPKLQALFKRSFPQVRVVGCQVPEAGACFSGLAFKPDFKLAMGSLPLYFRPSLESFPKHSGYLKADPGKVARWRERLAAAGPGRKIGISWKGGIHITREVHRTLKLEQMLPLLRLEGFQFISLQYTECKDEIARLKAEHGVTVHHWQDAIDDYDETAALVEALDLVVTVCTAVVHLGGGLGKPVWVMAPFSPGWRYAMVPGGMPWYPSVKVFRQAEPGAWPGVLDKVLSELRQTEAVGN